ncbi:hypothetical protein B0T26DRAFT_632880 [Lasiosphaeria miniovina]|uniref:G domain-containing protein n=1 Tax=Lasiosphaeria miniovina TaxID=1954250 RepID=A0AA40BHF1_9PEZI|nr:uncharacterized protein B0T26DRAFT_632880 [Lasiosphaeria miniovina]KAK0734297.1 hypothetical protein B0T26DRAFT_632880 [Lasiosphaeria miniovina]
MGCGQSTIQGEAVIAVMGMTGSGKSSFIQRVSKKQTAAVGHGLQSDTSAVSLHTVHRGNGRVHLVDTPGFDNSRLSDVEVLKLLAFWLSMAYSAGIRIGGIIYMQRITDLRMSGTSLRSLEAFKQLCGPDAFPGITFLTTGWDIPVISRDGHARAAAQQRQAELENTPRCVGDILAGGGAAMALLPGREAALALVDAIIRRRHNLVLRIQVEMTVGSAALGETGAGRTLREAHRRDMARAAELDA